MMLSIALSRMIDKCESVFFLNSENSISIAEEISKERTASPWIYNELSLADMIKIRPINCYRDEFLQFSHRAYDAVNESSSLQIKYEVDKILRSFISLSKYDLISCAKEWRANNKSFQSALDYICNGVQREHNKKLNNGLPILHKVPPKRDYGRYFCIMAEKGGTSHGGLTEKLSPFFHAKKQEVNAYGR